MLYISEIITESVSAAFSTCGYQDADVSVKISDRPDLCEYQCNSALPAAKKYSVNPMEIAEAVAGKLREEVIFEKVEALKPGFINMVMHPEFLKDHLKELAAESRLWAEGEKNPVKTVIDYGGANVAKPLHVGHLRSAVIGESLKRILRYAGNEVVADVHLGDWGLQMGLIIEQLREEQPGLPYFDENRTRPFPHEVPFTLEDLERMYPKASARSKEDEGFLKAAQETTLKLQEGYEPYREIWKHIMEISKKDLKRNYDALGVTFDLWKGESDAQPLIPDMIEDLKEQGIANLSQGALVIDVSEDGDTKEIPPCIIQKSDGAALYATSDLATIIDRKNELGAGDFVYVADKRQELHFTQVFRSARKAGLVEDSDRLEFIGFGTMNGKDGKPFKTRAGGVMRLEHLIEDIRSAVYDKITEGSDISGEELEDTTEKVALAALKYGDLSNQASRDYIFDIDRFTALEGNTGPYILYTAVRLKSILEKNTAAGGADVSRTDLGTPLTFKEKQLFLKAAQAPAALREAYEKRAPHVICRYVYELSDICNGFYHDTNILSESDEKLKCERLALITFIKDILLECLDLLGIEVPERM